MRCLLVVAAAAMTVLVSSGVAHAGKPANKACHGASISVLARNQAAPGSFGAAVVGFAQEPDGRPGLGDGIQALHVGERLPEDEVWAWCLGAVPCERAARPHGSGLVCVPALSSRALGSARAARCERSQREG